MASVNERVLECIEALPDATGPDLVELLPDVPKGSVASALTHLYVKRKVSRKQARTKDNRVTYMYRLVTDPSKVPAPTIRRYKPRTRALLNGVKTAPPHVTPTPTLRTDFAPSGSKASLRGRVRQLEDEVATLRSWKTEALLRYPDLAVEPAVLQARKIVADLLKTNGDATRAADVQAGKSDTTLIMKATIAALEKTV